jgi:hypothetical protein
MNWIPKHGAIYSQMINNFEGHLVTSVFKIWCFMPLHYRNHFPNDFLDEKIEDCVSKIVNDPNVPRILINRDDWWRRCKYVLDSECCGMKIRVILEPGDRGVLAVYPLDQDNPLDAPVPMTQKQLTQIEQENTAKAVSVSPSRKRVWARLS